MFGRMIAIGTVLAASAQAQAPLEAYTALVPPTAAWTAWQEETGELPPDFDALPSSAVPQPPLAARFTGNGEPITTTAAWERERAALLEQLHHYILGTVPPAPESVDAKIISERAERNATSRKVELQFGPGKKARLNLELFVPEGAGPFPVFMTQENHRAWGLVALRRGYAVVIYNGADSADDTTAFVDAYPGYDWSKLMRRAWAAGRCIDYLETVDRIDLAKIAITGHSRNGKQSLMAAAIEPRIAVVISSSSGAGGPLTTREYGEQQFGEGIELITRNFSDWFHPRMRWFVGREQKLPVDLHHLVAMTAPRPLLLATGVNDSVESTWAMERTVHHVRPVWELYGAESALRIDYRPGGHATTPTLIEGYIDWCDTQFGRANYAFDEHYLWPWDWNGWKAKANGLPSPLAYSARPFTESLADAVGDAAAWKKRVSAIREALPVLLGAPTPSAASPVGDYGIEKPYEEEMLRRSAPGAGLERRDIMFGDYVNADVYAPEGAFDKGEPLPTVLWLHPLSNAMGYVAGYHRGEEIYRTLARSGYAVIAYDQIGQGGRIRELEGFYDRYPGASVLAQMVTDAQAALDAATELPYVDAKRIYVVGYSLGALVASHVAALDERPAGFAFYCPPLPYRLDTNRAETGGHQRWSRDLMLEPRLALFEDAIDRVPFDLDELVAAAAPRPILYATPRYDREAPLPQADRAAKAIASIYAMLGAKDAFTRETPDLYNHFDPRAQRVVLEWLDRVSKK